MIEDALYHLAQAPRDYIIGQASFALHDILVRDVFDWSSANSLDIYDRIRAKLFSDSGDPTPFALKIALHLHRSAPLLHEDHISLAILVIRVAAMDLFTHTALSI